MRLARVVDEDVVERLVVRLEDFLDGLEVARIRLLNLTELEVLIEAFEQVLLCVLSVVRLQHSGADLGLCAERLLIELELFDDCNRLMLDWHFLFLALNYTLRLRALASGRG